MKRRLLAPLTRQPAEMAAWVLLSSLAFAVGHPAAADPDLTWIDRTAVGNREILVLAERGDRPLTVEVKIAAEVDAPATAIWDVLTACEIAPSTCRTS